MLIIIYIIYIYICDNLPKPEEMYSLVLVAYMELKEHLQRGRAESVFAGELCFPGRSPSDSPLFSSLCPAGLTDETTCCSSDPHSRSLEEIAKQHPGRQVKAQQWSDVKVVNVNERFYWRDEINQYVDTVPHSG